MGGNIDLIFLQAFRFVRAISGRNADIFILFTARLINNMRTGYAMDEFQKLFERAGNNVHTFNVRILWKDLVITRDPRVVQYILATGFSDFDKGKDQKVQYVRLLTLNHNITMAYWRFQDSLVCLATGYSIPTVPSGRNTAH